MILVIYELYKHWPKTMWTLTGLFIFFALSGIISR